MNGTESSLVTEYEKCVGLLQLERWDLLGEQATQMISAFPDSELGYEMLARCLICQGQLNEALPLIETAISIVPDRAELFMLRASIFLEQKKYDPALDSIQEAIRLEPDRGDLHKTNGHILCAMGKNHAAITQYEVSLRLDSDNEKTLAGIARAHLNLEQWLTAEEYYRRALEINPESSTCLNNLGVCLLNRDKQIDAIGAFKAAVRIDPDCELAKENLRTNIRRRIMRAPTVIFFLACWAFFNLWRANHQIGLDSYNFELIVFGLGLVVASLVAAIVISAHRRRQLKSSDPQLMKIYAHLERERASRKNKRR